MDCPSEENLIRMALGGLTGVGPMTFDLAGRQLRVVHTGEPARIAEKQTIRPVKGVVVPETGTAQKADETEA